MTWKCLLPHSSPDSDDTFPGEEPEEEFSMRDDQFLVSDRSENKFYGTLHGGSTGGSGVAAAVGPGLGHIGRRLQASPANRISPLYSKPSLIRISEAKDSPKGQKT
jgi:hypothetical protein